ncbi:MAG: ATP-binding protein [Parachlamydiales bacterium]
MVDIIGREQEKKILETLLASEEAELLALYGRRRIGKTFLVHEFFKDKGVFFELTGVLNGRLSEQLWNFSQVFTKTFQLKKRLPPPKRWRDAFEILQDQVEKIPENQKVILFLDELPWLATRRSDLLRFLEYFWNKHFSRRKNILLILCGSAASWMINKVICNRGGLHGRLTRQIHLQPFSLFETEQYLSAKGVAFDRKQLVEMYMVTGGVAKYLSQIEKGLSSAQNIDRLCFAPNAFLKEEFYPLFSSLFGDIGDHVSVVKCLAKSHKGKTLTQLAKEASITISGHLSQTLKELEASGFIKCIPFYGKKKREGLYRLVDEYSLFYLNWMEGQEKLLQFQRSHQFLSWAGYAFENICIKHIRQIIEGLKISVVAKNFSYWGKQVDETAGAQIDLIIDRTDRTLNLIEIKFCEDEFIMKKEYAEQLNRKKSLFSQSTKSRRTLFNTLITPFGAKKNPPYLAAVDQEVTLNALFIPLEDQ